MTGYWELKPQDRLDPYKCFTMDAEDLTDFITFSIDDRKELKEWEVEHILTQIKEGFQSGQWDSCD